MIEDLTGRYLKVLRACLGGQSNKYKVGDYLIIEKNLGNSGLYVVEYAGTLSLQGSNYDRISTGDVQLMPEGFRPTKYLPSLKSFPEDGVCWQPNQELRDYLIAREKSSTTACGFHVKGIAWNYNSCWEVVTYSGKPEYKIEQLEPWLYTPIETYKIGEDFISNASTDDFEIGKYYYIRESKKHESFMITKCEGFDSRDKYRINGPYLSNMNGKLNFTKSNTPWIGLDRDVCLASKEDSIWLDTCIKAGKFVKKKDVFPEKWCIKPTPDIYLELNSFLRERKDEWKHYDKDWNIESTKHWFHYPPASSHTHSELSVQPGYIEITTEQFKQQFSKLTTIKNKQDEYQKRETSDQGPIGESAICTGFKIHRPNLEIRRGCEIRADSFRCTKSKISIRG